MKLFDVDELESLRRHQLIVGACVLHATRNEGGLVALGVSDMRHQILRAWPRTDPSINGTADGGNNGEYLGTLSTIIFP